MLGQIVDEHRPGIAGRKRWDLEAQGAAGREARIRTIVLDEVRN
jgi:hypothetical protein